MSHDSFFDLALDWKQLGADPVCQYCCLQIPPADNGLWEIKFPQVAWQDNTVVVLHCQDFVNVDNDGCRELVMIEQHYGSHANRVVAVTWNIDLASVYTGSVNLIYFPYHSYEILVNLSNTVEQWQPHLQRPRTKNFNV